MILCLGPGFYNCTSSYQPSRPLLLSMISCCCASCRLVQSNLGIVAECDLMQFVEHINPAAVYFSSNSVLDPSYSCLVNPSKLCISKIKWLEVQGMLTWVYRYMCWLFCWCSTTGDVFSQQFDDMLGLLQSLEARLTDLHGRSVSLP